MTNETAPRYYETICIFNPNLSKETIDAKLKYIDKLVTDNEGEVLKASRWGTKTMAYEIGKFRQGYYVLFHLKGLPKMKNELERQMKISDDVLRYQTVLLSDKELKLSNDLSSRYEAEAIQKETRQEQERSKTADESTTGLAEGSVKEEEATQAKGVEEDLEEIDPGNDEEKKVEPEDEDLAEESPQTEEEDTSNK